MNRDSLIVFNGKIIEEENARLGLNRALKFGDGLFETIKIIDGEPQLWGQHMYRLSLGMQWLDLEYDPLFFDELLVDVHSLLLQKNINKGGRLRITIYRASKGNYTPESNGVNYLIETSESANGYPMNKKGLKIELSEKVTLYSKDPINAHKSLNAGSYIRASIEKQKRGFDDLILLNEKGDIVESTASNLFIVKANTCYTPDLSQGCLNGIMRQHLIKMLKEGGLKVVAKALTAKDLEEADEVFLTNSIRGLQWVGAFRNCRYYHSLSTKISNHINKK